MKPWDGVLWMVEFNHQDKEELWEPWSGEVHYSQEGARREKKKYSNVEGFKFRVVSYDRNEFNR